MTRKLSYTRLSKSRVKGLEHFSKEPLTAEELGQRMWPGHRMAKVNAAAVVRELLLGNYIDFVVPGAVPQRFQATPRAKEMIQNQPWLCKYCSLDTTDSMKRLWPYPCVGCESHHQVCRSCKKHLLKATGDFPYVVKLRSCPGAYVIVRAEKKKKLEPQGVQKEL